MTSTQLYSVQRLSNSEVPLANKFYRAHGFRGRAKRYEPCAVVRDEGSAIVACGYVRDFNRVQGSDSAQGGDGFRLLAGVAVDPAHQGKGIARLLLQHLSQAFDSRTYTFPYSHLVPFYTSLGFQPCEALFDEGLVEKSLVDEASIDKGSVDKGSVDGAAADKAMTGNSKSDQPSPVYDLYQGYRDQGREIAMMVYVASSLESGLK